MIVEAWRVQQGMGKACRLETQKELQLEFEGTLSDQEELMLQMKSKQSAGEFSLAQSDNHLSVLFRSSTDWMRPTHIMNCFTQSPLI